MDVDKKPLTSITYGYNNRTGDTGAYNPKEVKKLLSRKLNRVSQDLQDFTASATTALRDGEDSKGYTEKANKASEEKKYLESQAVLYTKNPEVYSQLYAIQDSVKNGDEGNNVSPIRETAKGELYLNIELQMEGSPIGFALRDGKVTFGDNEVSPEQMKEVMDFLYMRGISNFDLPKGADPKIADSFEKAQEGISSERVEDDISRPSGMVATGNENDEVPDEQLSPAERWDREQAEAIAKGQGNLAGASVEVGDSYTPDEEQPSQEQASQQQPSEPEKAKETGFKKAEKELTEWFEKGMKKKSEYTYFKRAGSVVLGNGGWTVFSSYENGNEDNIKMDGKRDKKGNVNSTYEYRIYIRPDKSGKGIDVAYGMPKGKRVSEDVADEVLDLYKSQGVTHVNLSKMSYGDAADFRKACGRKLVVPTGTGLDKRKVSQIIDNAKDRGSEEEILKYKYQLAVQMEKNFAKKYPGKKFEEVNATDAEFAQDLKDEYKFTPFRNMYLGGLREVMDNECGGASAQADRVIGTNIAFAKIFDMYKEKEQPTWKDVQKNINENIEKMQSNPKYQTDSKYRDEVAALQLSFRELSKVKPQPNADTKMRDLPVGHMKVLFSSMIPAEQEVAKERLDAEFVENNSRPDAQQDTPSTIIRNLVSESRDQVMKVSEKLEECNVKKFNVTRFNTPKYDFSHLPSNGKKKNNNNNGNQNSNGGR